VRPRRGEVWWGEEPEPLGQLTERVCDLSPERMAEVCAALDAATEC
jgi:mRNA-degrading endonuclease toxin of MazEF toxin-antitoxin module